MLYPQQQHSEHYRRYRHSKGSSAICDTPRNVDHLTSILALVGFYHCLAQFTLKLANAFESEV